MLTKAELSTRLSTIEGWLFADEAWELYHSAASLGHPTPTVVEIGSWKGKSTIALALGLLESAGGNLYAIDPHMGSSESPALDTYADFLHNIKSAAVSSVVTPLRMRSHDARERFRPASVDLLFVDGSHEYEDVLRDIDDWSPTLTDGAIIGFNDPLSPGVCRALLQRVVVSGSPFHNRRLVNNTMFFRFGISMRSAQNPATMRRARALLRALLIVQTLADHVRPYLAPWLRRGGHRVLDNLRSRFAEREDVGAEGVRRLGL